MIVSIGEVGVNLDFYPWIRLFDPNGGLVITRNSGAATQFEVTANLTGTYTLRVGSNNSNTYFDGTGDYVLRRVKVPGTYVVSQGDQGGTMTNGDNHTGHIDLGDVDVWTFAANQNDAIAVSIGEIPVGPSDPDPGFYPWIRLYNPLGAPVQARNGGDVAQIGTGILTAPITGTYTVVVGTNNSNIYFDGTGDYILTLAKVPGTFVVPTGDHGGLLTNGAIHTGRIDLGDLDMWSFSANQGDAITVSIGEVLVSPTEPDPGFYPWIRLYDPLGALAGTRNGGNVAQVVATAGLTGT